jgi:hypothetical protein
MSANTYRITRGSFLLPDGSYASAGQLIELPEDVAAAHPDRLEPVALDATTQPEVAATQEPEA